MAEGYTKLLSSIRFSSIWKEPDDVLRVWVTLLTMADSDGYVGACADGIAHESRTVSEERVIEILGMFQSPDPRSRSEEYEGRRIQKVDRGWLVLNYKKIRDMHGVESTKASKREWWAKNRGLQPIEGPLESRESSGRLAHGSDNANVSSGVLDPDRAPATPSAKPNKRPKGVAVHPPDPFEPTEATLRCATKYKRDWKDDWESCVDHHLKKGNPICDWQAALRTWMKMAPGFERTGLFAAKAKYGDPAMGNGAQPNDPRNPYRPRMSTDPK
jgi:hypothetical protein